MNSSSGVFTVKPSSEISKSALALLFAIKYVVLMQCFITRDLPASARWKRALLTPTPVDSSHWNSSWQLLHFFPFQMSGLCRALGYNLHYMYFRERGKKGGGHFESLVSAKQRQIKGKSNMEQIHQRVKQKKRRARGVEEHREL